MKITDLLTVGRIVCAGETASKKRCLEWLGELIAQDQPDLTAREVFDTLVGRERLGSTGLGHGVALPHGRLGRLEGAIGAFVTLREGIDFDAIDHQPVDLIFALLVPDHFTDEHLKILAYLAEMFSDEAFCDQMRSAESKEDRKSVV